MSDIPDELCPCCSQPHAVPDAKSLVALANKAAADMKSVRNKAKEAIVRSAEVIAVTAAVEAEERAEWAVSAMAWAFDITTRKDRPLILAVIAVKMFFYSQLLRLTMPLTSFVCGTMLFMGFDDVTVERMACRGYALNTLLMGQIVRVAAVTTRELV